MNLNRMIYATILFLVIGWTVFVVGDRYGWFETQPVAGPSIDDPDQSGEDLSSVPQVDAVPLSEALGVGEDELIEIGGIQRPKRDVAEIKVDLAKQRQLYKAGLTRTGRAPIIPQDATPQVAALVEELEENPGSHPARSLFFEAEPFDLATYQEKPEAYLELVRPGRVFQAKEPAKGVARLVSISPTYQDLLQGETVNLEVKADAGMPVTFHTQQLGEFENRLKTISVAASQDGVAKVSYTAVTGVQGLVRIMASSPVHSHRLTYLIRVNLPEQ